MSHPRLNAHFRAARSAPPGPPELTLVWGLTILIISAGDTVL
jgi:hypothetical protein